MKKRGRGSIVEAALLVADIDPEAGDKALRIGSEILRKRRRAELTRRDNSYAAKGIFSRNSVKEPPSLAESLMLTA